MLPRMSTPPWMTRSMSVASTRDPSPAVSNDRTTASGVTSRGCSTAPRVRRVPRYGRAVDVDRFLVVHGPAWDRLAALTGKARRGVGRLDAIELDELVRLYQRTSTHLSYARTYYRDPALVARLTGLVAAAGSVVYGARPRTFRALARFFTTTFPAAVWHARRAMAVSAALLLAPALALAILLSRSVAALEATAPAAVREVYLEDDFEAYYSSEPAGA